MGLGQLTSITIVAVIFWEYKEHPSTEANYQGTRPLLPFQFTTASPVAGVSMNRTVKGAKQVHGKDPQLLVEKITRERIFECRYWKEHCFGLDTERLLGLAAGLDHVGGTYSNVKPTPFLCLTLRLLQLQPDEDVVQELVAQEDFKYVRVLGLVYWRLVLSPAAQVYRRLEPYLRDRRKIRIRQANGTFGLEHVDGLVDQMLRDDRVLGIILPRLASRMVLEETEDLPPRQPLLEDVEEDLASLEPPVAGDAEPLPAAEFAAGNGESLGLEETNALRAQLGLKPLSA